MPNQKHIHAIQQIIFELFQVKNSSVPIVDYMMAMKTQANSTSDEEQGLALQELIDLKYVIFEDLKSVRSCLRKGLFFNDWEKTFEASQQLPSNTTNNITITNSKFGDNTQVGQNNKIDIKINEQDAQVLLEMIENILKEQQNSINAKSILEQFKSGRLSTAKETLKALIVASIVGWLLL